MRVDDVGAVGAEFADERGDLEEIVRRRDVAAHVRVQDEPDGESARVVEEASLGPGFGAGDEGNAVSAPGEAAAREERVLLRAADDEPRDDVRDSHGDILRDAGTYRGASSCTGDWERLAMGG
jgi:hypothetical protein